MKLYGLGTYTPPPLEPGLINFFTVTIKGQNREDFKIELNKEARQRGDQVKTIFSDLSKGFSIDIKNEIKTYGSLANPLPPYIMNYATKKSFNSQNKGSILSGSVGTSAAVKRAWQRRSKYSKSCGCLYFRK